MRMIIDDEPVACESCGGNTIEAVCPGCSAILLAACIECNGRYCNDCEYDAGDPNSRPSI